MVAPLRLWGLGLCALRFLLCFQTKNLRSWRAVTKEESGHIECEDLLRQCWRYGRYTRFDNQTMPAEPTNIRGKGRPPRSICYEQYIRKQMREVQLAWGPY